MDTLWQILYYNRANTVSQSDLIGIEVEVEQADNRIITPALRKYWNAGADGSLRNGVEFVSHPMSTPTMIIALSHLFAALKDKCEITTRCATHIHFDVCSLTVRQLVLFCSFYAEMERALFLWEGNKRNQNIFCIPWFLSDYPIPTLKSLLSYTKGEPINIEGLGRAYRYSAFSLNPLVYSKESGSTAIGTGLATGLGTMELRILRTVLDVDKIVELINIIHGAMHVARYYDENMPWQEQVPDMVREVVSSFSLEPQQGGIIRALLKQQQNTTLPRTGWDVIDTRNSLLNKFLATKEKGGG